MLLFFGCSKKSSDNQVTTSSDDSLTTYMSKANDFGSTTKARQEYIQKAFSIVINQENDSLQRVNLFRVANRYYNLNDWKKYQEITKIVLEKSLSSKDTLSTAKAYSYLGDYYGAQGVSDTAFLSYFKAEKIYLQRNDNYNLARTRLNKALLQYKKVIILGAKYLLLKLCGC